MKTLGIDEQTMRDQLRAQRNLLFNAFLNSPANTPLAIKIKSIDDGIAELTGQIMLKQKLEQG